MRSMNGAISSGISAVAWALLCITLAAPAQAQFPPPPPSVGAAVPATYFGPVPSDVKREYVGPYQLLKSGKIDLSAETITLPLYLGLLYSVREPKAIWYSIELQSLTEQDPSFGITYAYTRATPKDWPRPPGRIDAALVAKATWPSSLGSTCYVCGPTSFVESAASFLTASGNSPDRIRTERFGPTGDRK